MRRKCPEFVKISQFTTTTKPKNATRNCARQWENTLASDRWIMAFSGSYDLVAFVEKTS
jgi:hypothetical protein